MCHYIFAQCWLLIQQIDQMKKEVFNQEIKILTKSLEHIILKQQKETEKKRLNQLKIKYESKPQSKNEMLKGLTPPQKQQLKILVNQFKAHLDAFNELAKKSQNKEILQFNVFNFLYSIQPNIALDNPNAKYTVQILKQKKNHTNWPTDFFKEWIALTKNKIKQITQNENKAALQSKPKSDDESISKQISESSERSSIHQKSFVPIKKDIKKEKEKEMKDIKQLREFREERLHEIRQPKNRVGVIDKYLNARKDLHFGSQSKAKDVAQYLTAKLEQFMKYTLEKVLNIAILKNKKSVKYGNELSYFQNQHKIVTQMPFFISPNTSISALYYPHKLQIYTAFRYNQFKKEDQLRQQLEQKIEAGQKKIQKKIQGYLLKPRVKDGDAVVPWKEQNVSSNKPTSLTITMEHVIYYLENHPLLQQSVLLFNAYQN